MYDTNVLVLIVQLSTDDKLEFVIISEQNVLNVFSNLKFGKASDHDNIINILSVVSVFLCQSYAIKC